MRSHLLNRRRSAPTVPGCDLRKFEFAHLLDVVSHVLVEDLPDVEPDAVPDIEPDVVPDIEPNVAADIMVSRFADSGLDDDRLPLAVKRRRGRRR